MDSMKKCGKRCLAAAVAITFAFAMFPGCGMISEAFAEGTTKTEEAAGMDIGDKKADNNRNAEKVNAEKKNAEKVNAEKKNTENVNAEKASAERLASNRSFEKDKKINTSNNANHFTESDLKIDDVETAGEKPSTGKESYNKKKVEKMSACNYHNKAGDKDFKNASDIVHHKMTGKAKDNEKEVIDEASIIQTQSKITNNDPKKTKAKTKKVTARKKWLLADGKRDKGEHPTIYLKLYGISGGSDNLVQLGGIKMLEGVDYNTENGAGPDKEEKWKEDVTWQNIPVTNDAGDKYEYIVQEVDLSGAPYIPSGYTKIESGLTVTNIRMEQKPDDNQNPGTDQKPDDNQNPGTDQKPDDNQNPGTDQKPDDNQNPGTDQNPDQEGDQNPSQNPPFDPVPPSDESEGGNILPPETINPDDSSLPDQNGSGNNSDNNPDSNPENNPDNNSNSNSGGVGEAIPQPNPPSGSLETDRPDNSNLFNDSLKEDLKEDVVTDLKVQAESSPDENQNAYQNEDKANKKGATSDRASRLSAAKTDAAKSGAVKTDAVKIGAAKSDAVKTGDLSNTSFWMAFCGGLMLISAMVITTAIFFKDWKKK